MEVLVVDKLEIYEVLETLLEAMEESITREMFSLPFCDAWLEAERLLIELSAELQGE